MGYIHSNLMKGEKIVYQSKVHWFIFVPGCAMLLFGIFFTLCSKSLGSDGPAMFSFFAGIFFFAGIIYLVKAFITAASIELAVTSKRVIAKFGFISRTTVELNHSKVESFNVDQGVLGRIFGFGTLVLMAQEAARLRFLTWMLRWNLDGMPWK